LLEGYPPHLEPLAPRAFVANASLVSRSAVLCAALWLGVWSAIATEAPTAITRSATIIALIVWYNSALLSQGRGGFSGFSPPRPPATQARADASILPRPMNHLSSGPVLASTRETRSRGKRSFIISLASSSLVARTVFTLAKVGIALAWRVPCRCAVLSCHLSRIGLTPFPPLVDCTFVGAVLGIHLAR
jgi:hypothetical protein